MEMFLPLVLSKTAVSGFPVEYQDIPLGKGLLVATDGQENPGGI